MAATAKRQGHPTQTGGAATKISRTQGSESLRQIEAALDEHVQRHGSAIPERTSDELAGDPGLVQRDLDTFGVFVLRDAVSADSLASYRAAVIRELSLHLFQVDDPLTNAVFAGEHRRVAASYPDLDEQERLLATLCCWWNSKSGFGNCSFRFLYMQPVEESPVFDVDGEQVEFSRNPYHRHGVHWLASNPLLWQTLKGLHPPGSRPMVSWDSQKLRFAEPRPKKPSSKAVLPALTPPHRDVYLAPDGAAVDRVQAMLIEQHQRAVALGFVPYSHAPDVRALMEAYHNSSAFSRISDPGLHAVLHKYWRAPTRGFVVWRQGVVHYEAVPDEHRRLLAYDQPKDRLPLMSIRAVIGTHVPIGLTDAARVQLAFLSEHGWAPEMYKHKKRNKSTSVHPNIVNAKSTQWLRPRVPPPLELAQLEETRAAYSQAAAVVAGWPEIIREMYSC